MAPVECAGNIGGAGFPIAKVDGSACPLLMTEMVSAIAQRAARRFEFAPAILGFAVCSAPGRWSPAGGFPQWAPLWGARDIPIARRGFDDGNFLFRGGRQWHYYRIEAAPQGHSTAH